MNVVLIFPPTTVYGNDPTRPTPTPPLGLLYIAAVLERDGHAVTVIDSIAEVKGEVTVQGNGRRYGLGYEAIADRVKGVNPDMVGISCMFTAYAGDVHRLSQSIKREVPDVFLVTGGAYASAYPRYILEDRNIDCVVLGEGEATMIEIMKHLSGDLRLDEIRGIAFRKDGIITETKRRPPISDIDSIPFPARHLVDMNVYVNASFNGVYALRSPSLTMITSRGCPEDCIYCTVKNIWHRKWRGHSAKRVVDEIELLQQQYGIREIYFMDDSAAVSRRRMHEICDEITRRGIDISWTLPNGVAYWTLDRDLVRAMKRAGCYRLTFG
ncbi:MAG: radical SAM protein, partial [Desulfobacteraceae bacterium]